MPIVLILTPGMLGAGFAGLLVAATVLEDTAVVPLGDTLAAAAVPVFGLTPVVRLGLTAGLALMLVAAAVCLVGAAVALASATLLRFTLMPEA